MSHAPSMHLNVWFRHDGGPRGYRGSFADPRFGRFQRIYAVKALAKQTLRLHMLCIGDSIAGVAYNFRVGDCIQAYMTAFDAAWADYSPGSRVMERTAQMAIAEGATSLDLLEGGEEYKEYWAISGRMNVRLLAYNSTAAGRLAHFRANAAAHAVVLARRTVPEPARLAARRQLGALHVGHIQ